jgi:hypothetical protein
MVATSVPATFASPKEHYNRWAPVEKCFRQISHQNAPKPQHLMSHGCVEITTFSGLTRDLTEPWPARRAGWRATALSIRPCWSGPRGGATATIWPPWLRWRSGNWRPRRWPTSPVTSNSALPLAAGRDALVDLVGSEPAGLGRRAGFAGGPPARRSNSPATPRSSAEVASALQLTKVGSLESRHLGS